MDHRDYQPDDDLRRIDWHAYVGFDRLTVKLYREEVSPHLDILADASCSMAIEGSAKAEATLGLAAAFAGAASNAGFTHCGWMAGEDCRPIAGGTRRPSTWDGISFEFPGTAVQSLAQLPPNWRASGPRVPLGSALAR